MVKQAECDNHWLMAGRVHFLINCIQNWHLLLLVRFHMKKERQVRH